MPQAGYFTFHQTITANGTTYFDGDLLSNWRNPSYLSYMILQQPAALSQNDLYFDNIQVQTVPEPWAICFVGAGGVLGMFRRKGQR